MVMSGSTGQAIMTSWHNKDYYYYNIENCRGRANTILSSTLQGENWSVFTTGKVNSLHIYLREKNNLNRNISTIYVILSRIFVILLKGCPVAEPDCSFEHCPELMFLTSTANDGELFIKQRKATDVSDLLSTSRYTYEDLTSI
ncbi:Uncharacterized protein TCM_030372 [Theobroma cacao]|uniref:Uncharacterized protein n=1 Tax=Theobroma cacao TaxID=3641 RepID=A0A061GH39_THECC|nr:Uncharacterized protein TCM_030372 [Theobroma cacao]